MAVGQQSVGIIVVKNLRLKLQVLELLDVQLDLIRRSPTAQVKLEISQQRSLASEWDKLDQSLIEFIPASVENSVGPL